MKNSSLAACEHTCLVLAVVATCVGGLIWGAPGMKAAAVGAAVACANLLVISRVASRAIRRVLAGEGPAVAALGAGMTVKMLVLFGLVWLAVATLQLPLAPFALGLSVMVVSLVLSGLWVGLREKAV